MHRETLRTGNKVTKQGIEKLGLTRSREGDTMTTHEKTLIVQFNKKLSLPPGTQVKSYKTEFCKVVDGSLTVLLSVTTERKVEDSPLTPTIVGNP